MIKRLTIIVRSIAKGNTLGATKVNDKKNLSHVTRYY